MPGGMLADSGQVSSPDAGTTVRCRAGVSAQVCLVGDSEAAEGAHRMAGWTGPRYNDPSTRAPRQPSAPVEKQINRNNSATRRERHKYQTRRATSATEL